MTVASNPQQTQTSSLWSTTSCAGPRGDGSFADADQARVDEAVTALAWSLYKPEHAKELAELAVEGHRARQRAGQDHQEAAQDLRHLARPDAGQDRSA